MALATVIGGTAAASIVAAGPAGTATVTEPATRVGDVVRLPSDQRVPPRRAYMVADSVFAGIDAYRQTGRLTGTEWFTDPGVCRRLATTSCQVSGYSRPPTLVQELSSVPFTPDAYDLFVVATGYNDSAEFLDTYWNRIVGAIRAAGFEHIAWINYRTSVGGSTGRNAAAQNAILAERAARDGIIVWDFDTASSGQPWFGGDGLHLTSPGAAAIADWLSSMIATIDVG